MIDVAVAGSLHLDIMVEAPRLPGRDETLIGSAWHTKCGGKGGNQAVAAARFGARTAFGGRVGQDDFGDRLLAHLAGAGIDIRHVGRDPVAASGMSVAISEAAGEYGAVVVSGANRGIDAAAIDKAWAALWACRVLLLQNEVDEAVNLAAAGATKAHGAMVVLNAAPARKIDEGTLALVDVLVVNRVEAAMLSGVGGDPEAAIRALADARRDVVLTLGSGGVLVQPHHGTLVRIPPLQVRMVSSHGAGDCFCGALAARLAAGDDLDSACRFANAAAGVFVSLAEGDRARIDAAMVRGRMRES